MSLSEYRAADRRVYDGAPCSDMAREWANEDMLVKRLEAADRTASVTYFPVEGKWLAFTNTGLLKFPDLIGPPKVLTDRFHVSRQACLIEAIQVLEARNNNNSGAEPNMASPQNQGEQDETSNP